MSVSLKLLDILGAGTSWEASALFGALPGEHETIIRTAEEMCNLCWNIKKDKSTQGGLLVLKFEKV